MKSTEWEGNGQNCHIIIQVKELGPYLKGYGENTTDFKQKSDKYIHVYVCKCSVILPKIVCKDQKSTVSLATVLRNMYESWEKLKLIKIGNNSPIGAYSFFWNVI